MKTNQAKARCVRPYAQKLAFYLTYRYFFTYITSMILHFKLSLLNDQGVPFMGRGPVALLRGIERLGSINQAAKEMNMSYVKAWKIIKKMEASLGGKILKTQIGGKEYGGSELTPLTVRFLDIFTAYEAEVINFAEEQFTVIKEHLEALGKGVDP